MLTKEHDNKPTLAFLDHSLNIEPFRQLMEKKFDIVVASHNRIEVIRKIDELKPDALLMDFRIDGEVDIGCKVIGEVKQLSPKTKVVVITSLPESPLYLMKAFQAGADGYISRMKTGISLDIILHSVIMGLTVISPRSILQKVIEASSKVVEYDERFTGDPNSRLRAAEVEILQLVLQGLANSEIATKLNKAIPTIKGQLHTINQKLGCATREEAVRLAIFTGQLQADNTED